jgi:hypothetical protein
MGNDYIPIENNSINKKWVQFSWQCIRKLKKMLQLNFSLSVQENWDVSCEICVYLLSRWTVLGNLQLGCCCSTGQYWSCPFMSLTAAQFEQ